jgi:predicted ATPase
MQAFVDEDLDLGIGEEFPSSGQKHYQSLMLQFFGAQNESLLMVDEPEISLHIEWQRSFITRLLEMRERLAEFSEEYYFPILISTHSPDIIYHHQDLVVTIPPLLEG